ncbi:MAG: PepSY-associated TM helix domain-containing protein [Pseudohongiella sp.]
MMADMHVYLHLPSSFGMIVVSILGAMLCGLIISGLFAHPNIIRDAFNLRLRGSRRLQQTDIHNRLSVWGAPFHLVIAVTGAYFGLAVLMNMIFASAFFDGDNERVIGEIFGAPPALQQDVAVMDVEAALNELAVVAPEANPFYVTVEDANTPQQYMIIGAEHEGRLIYAEQYRFDQAGQYLGKAGYTDGALGRQAIFSVFRLHFGHFGGLSVLFLYGVFGLALCVVCVSGINIWLSRRKTRDALNNIWTGLVWGTPAAIAGSALLVLLAGLPAVASLWLVLVACIALAQVLNNDAGGKSMLQLLSGGLVLGLVVLHVLKYQQLALRDAALAVNVCFAASGLILLWLGLRSKRKTNAVAAPANA